MLPSRALKPRRNDLGTRSVLIFSQISPSPAQTLVFLLAVYVQMMSCESFQKTQFHSLSHPSSVLGSFPLPSSLSSSATESSSMLSAVWINSFFGMWDFLSHSSSTDF